jgi:2-succinyl-5-enolpyruvyl-6-hydroxy-3-cyclohexene-1-carboxylate synthase
VIDQAWAKTAIETCLANGIDHFFLAPGSRCTPLTLAVARQQNAHVIQHFDERGLAFAAIGYGRATGRPGVFICTSGTAVANAFPAVIEAAIEHIPMLLFTADRPPELHGSGANQTIDQKEIFGSYPKLFVNMPVPDSNTSLSEPLDQGIVAASDGPVHINWMFREPFTIDTEIPTRSVSEVKPIPRSHFGLGFSSSNEEINLRGNVLIAVGNCKPSEAQQAIELSQSLNCPILSDVTSGLRTGSFELPTEFSLPKPDTILHIGDRIVSKSWHRWTERLRNESVDLVHLTSTGQTVNPNRLPIKQYQTDLIELSSKVTGSNTTAFFLKSWTGAAAQRSDIVDRQLAEAKKLSEPALAFFISKQCPASHGLFLGNSTPIRDMDWFGEGLSDKVRLVEANRGASGIDGLLATATGYAAGLQQPTTVVVGDLSALHDLNSLSLVAKSRWPLIVLVINNQGGHIFDLLPIRESKHFEQFFATPHTYQFENAAKMFGIDYRRVTEMGQLAKSYREALSQDQSIVIEVVTDRSDNLEVRKQIKEEIAKCSDRS